VDSSAAPPRWLFLADSWLLLPVRWLISGWYAGCYWLFSH